MTSAHRYRFVVAITLAAVAVAGCPGPVDDRPRAEKAFTSFALLDPAASGAIDEEAKTVSLAVPFSTDVSALVAVFTTTGAGVAVEGVQQVSGVTPNDFSNPVVYVVTAADGTTSAYTVTVSIGPSPAKAFTSFALLDPAASGAIDEEAKTVSLTVPFCTDVSALVAVFTTTGAGVAVEGVQQGSGVTPNDFSNPVVYVVTAADGSSAAYTVTVSIGPSPAKALTSFALLDPAATGAIDEEAKTVSLTVPFSTDVSALVAVFTTTGAGVAIGGVQQGSGVTPNDFSNPVVYVVTAADGSSAAYTVTIGRAPPQPGRLVINEIDYDQAGTDNAEFVELYNPGDGPLLLDGLVLVAVNGGSTPNAEYARVPLGSGALGAGGYLVVCGSTFATPPGTAVVRFAGSTNCLQNGSPDAVLVFDTAGGRVIDALTYEGGYLGAVTLVGVPGTVAATEGEGTSAADSNTVEGSLARWPNGSDTGDNDADCAFSTTPTPGAANRP
jgi:hypothetical protein